MRSRQPNILLIQSDQHRYDGLSARGGQAGARGETTKAGHPLPRTASLDRLAAEGVSFSRAYCPIPVCVPARNSLITGVWPSQHRVIANWGYNLLVRIMCGIAYRDAQCALKIFVGDVVRSFAVEARGFTFPTEILIKLKYYGYNSEEISVSHRHRQGGESKVSFFKTIRIMFTFLLYIRFKRFLHEKRIIYEF